MSPSLKRFLIMFILFATMGLMTDVIFGSMWGVSTSVLIMAWLSIIATFVVSYVLTDYIMSRKGGETG